MVEQAKTAMQTGSNGDHEGMVSIGSYSLYINVAGPERRPGEPLVIVVAGMGDSHWSWKGVQRLASRHHRVCLYERSGIGRSASAITGPRTAGVMALELQELLHAAELRGPYVVVAHSYGAIVAREFMALDETRIAGMLFVDSEQELSYKRLQVPWDSVHAVLGNLDYYETTGLDAEHVLTSEEWQRIKDEENKNQAAVEAEQAESDGSCDTLAEKQQLMQHSLHPKPVAVLKANSLREYTRILKAGADAGNGTPEQRAEMEALMERMRELEEPLQREQMLLSPGHSRFIHVQDGHNVQVTNPEIIVSELAWVMERA